MRASANQLIGVLLVAGAIATYQERVKVFYVEGKSYFVGQPETYSYSLDSGLLPAKYHFDKDGYYTGNDYPESAKELEHKDHKVTIIDRLQRTSRSIDENNGKFTFTGEARVEVVDTVIAKMTLEEFVERHHISSVHPTTRDYTPAKPPLVYGPMSTKSDWKYGTVSTRRRWVMQFTDPVTGSMSEVVQYLGTVRRINTQSYPPTSVNHGGWKN